MRVRAQAAIILVGIALVPQIAGAQSVSQRSSDNQPVDPKLSFEVASIRPTTSGPESAQRGFRGGRFTARYVTFVELIRSAYGKPEYTLTASQVVGGPVWLGVDHFDVEATAPGIPDSSRGTFSGSVLTMLRNLLEERFSLKAHFETRGYPLFALVLARPDGALGPSLRRRTVDCTPVSPTVGIGALADGRNCGGRAGPGMLTANGATMTNLASGLAQFIPDVGRVVVDRTALTGTFDIDLRWTPETPQGVGNQSALPKPSFDPGAPPSLFTALREQLGLKLEATNGVVDVLVIDHVEQPTPN